MTEKDLSTITENLRSDQKFLVATIIERAVTSGDFSTEEIKLVLIGMTFGGPLGKGCPEWRVRAMAEAFASGPRLEKDLFRGGAF